ncbi:unnamed protein product [Schistosoma mattheei]|uniref:Uncharacterized protein n=1 Tax=Schistosoma mattheei TaxID=31246 RepID=A0A183PUH0_9TREM|nr:unnamed protein product [Schistosoma mattheei]
MPSPLLNFDLLIVKNLPLPFVCVGVYRHHSRKGREGQRFRLHLIDLNSSGPNPPQIPPVVSSIPPISLSSVAAAVSVTAMASTTSTTITTSTTTTTTTTNSVSPNHSGLLVDSSTSPHSVISHSENIHGLNDSVELTSSNNIRLTNKTQVVLKSDQTKAELQRKNTLFLHFPSGWPGLFLGTPLCLIAVSRKTDLYRRCCYHCSVHIIE